MIHALPCTKEYFESTCGPKLMGRLDKSDSLYVVYKETCYCCQIVEIMELGGVSLSHS